MHYTREQMERAFVAGYSRAVWDERDGRPEREPPYVYEFLDRLDAAESARPQVAP